MRCPYFEYISREQKTKKEVYLDFLFENGLLK